MDCVCSMRFVSCRRTSFCSCFFFQAEDGIRDLVRSRGLGDVYKRQVLVGMSSDDARMHLRGRMTGMTNVRRVFGRKAEYLSLIHI